MRTRSTSPDKIHKGQVLHPTRRDPLGGDCSDTFSWVRSACPGDPARGREEWRPIEPARFTNDELLEDVATIERLVPGPPSAGVASRH